LVILDLVPATAMFLQLLGHVFTEHLTWVGQSACPLALEFFKIRKTKCISIPL
jgi:hypothetical protein